MLDLKSMLPKNEYLDAGLEVYAGYFDAGLGVQHQNSQ